MLTIIRKNRERVVVVFVENVDDNNCRILNEVEMSIKTEEHRVHIMIHEFENAQVWRKEVWDKIKAASIDGIVPRTKKRDR